MLCAFPRGGSVQPVTARAGTMGEPAERRLFSA